ncbi:MAG: hypothetical protein OXF66_04910 [Gammaproteobacteria bacterium]|nr:hypothetical protein [Gammaproteobacteria bacterium]
MTKKPKPLVLKPKTYQPSKAELEEEISLLIPGKDVHERARNLARAVLQPVEIKASEFAK